MTDRYHKKFMVRSECLYCYNILYNPDPLVLFGQEKEIRALAPGALLCGIYLGERGENPGGAGNVPQVALRRPDAPVGGRIYPGAFQTGSKVGEILVNIIVEVSKYLMIILMTVYTYLCFSIFGFSDPDRKQRLLRKQNVLMFAIQLVAYMVMYLQTEDIRMLGFYLMQVVLFGATILLYTNIYPKVSRLVVNNMCMLLCIGMIMLTRLDYENAVKQYVIAAGAIALSLVVPVIIRKFKLLSEWRTFYGVAGLFSLAIVVVIGQVSYGAMLGFSIGGISVQPSEVVKIIFVFFVASSFKKSLEFRNIVITTAVAAFHVLILVISRDLGAALIIFIVYLAMLYVATRQPLYVLAGLGAGSVASVAAYYLFSHVRTRVIVWRDPFAAYDNGGYQVAQSLFAIGTGGWFGMGLFQGEPDTIPVASEDFIFSAIAEEMGIILHSVSYWSASVSILCFEYCHAAEEHVL